MTEGPRSIAMLRLVDSSEVIETEMPNAALPTCIGTDTDDEVLIVNYSRTNLQKEGQQHRLAQKHRGLHRAGEVDSKWLKRSHATLFKLAMRRPAMQGQG